MKNGKIIIEEPWEIIVGRSIEEVEALRFIWEEMQNNEPYPVINADIDRYLSVVKSHGKDVQPYIILLKQNSHPSAMVISRIEQHHLRLKLGYKVLFRPMLRCLSIVYGGVIGKPTSNLYIMLIRELMKILRDREADVVLFNHLRTDSPLYSVARQMPGLWCRGYFPKVETHWVMSVPENIDGFYAERSRKHRKHLMQYLRKLEKEYPDQVRVVTYAREDEVEDLLRIASQISAKTYQKALGAGIVDDDRVRTMLKTASRKGWLRGHLLFIGDQPCAYRIALRYRNTYFGHGTGYDPAWKTYRVGTILFLKVMEQICRDPTVDFIDFGFGDAEYKHSYGNKRWSEASVCIFAPRFYPIFVNMLRTFVMGLSVGIEYILKRIGFLARLKRRWRNLLQRGNKH